MIFWLEGTLGCFYEKFKTVNCYSYVLEIFCTFLQDISVILILMAMKLERTGLEKEMLFMYCKFRILERNQCQIVSHEFDVEICSCSH